MSEEGDALLCREGVKRLGERLYSVGTWVSNELHMGSDSADGQGSMENITLVHGDYKALCHSLRRALTPNSGSMKA